MQKALSPSTRKRSPFITGVHIGSSSDTETMPREEQLAGYSRRPNDHGIRQLTANH